MKIAAIIISPLLLLAALVLVQKVEPQQIEPDIVPYDFPDSLANYQWDLDSIKTVIGDNKGLPPGYELAAAIAYSAYPELKDVKIDMTLVDKGAPMESNFDLWTMFVPGKKNRLYKILLLEAEVPYDPILMKNLPLDAQVEILKMLKNSKRLILIVLGTIVLPLVMYMVYEVSSLQEDEEVIQRIYENQLDFVIFSANQYSNDFLDGLVNSVEEDLESSSTYQIRILISLLLIGFILIGRNIYKQMQLAQTKSDFVSNVSHELRTPLALISMFAETLLLQRVKSEEKKSEYIEIIFKETNRLTRIVNRILNFSQVEADRKKYHFISMDINAIVDELMHDYSFHLEHNGFEYEFEKVDELVNIQADKETIYEALVNLMDNAIKYSRDEKYIAIRTKIRGEHAIIEVQDKGIGIPKENLKHIFDKFFRVSEGDVHTVQGAGLGLSLVASIMEAHGGNIELESKLGEGSTFRLVFNLSEAHQEAHATLQEPQLTN
ncbi:rprX [Symbiodinium sp. KB8]|nr:rprX [Symbiodinium sp. KB8]